MGAERSSHFTRKAVKDGGKCGNRRVFHLSHWDWPAKKLVQGCNPFVGDPARDNQPELIEVSRHIEREPVAGDPAGNPDADRRELFQPARRFDPHAGEPLLPHGRDTERRSDANHDFLEVADISVHVEAVGPQIEDRIADELTRAVERHVSASARFEKLDTVSFERLRSREHVRAIVAGPDSERDDRRVLEQEELIGNPVGLPFLDELLLEFQRLGVSDDPEPTNFDGSRRRRG